MSKIHAPVDPRVVETPDTLSGGGECGALIRAHDWSSTSLGPIEAWPQSLRTAVQLMLASRQPVHVAWGPELTSLYNDAYIPIVGSKHPGGLGRTFDELWAEIRDEYRPLVEAVMAGDAQHFVDRPAALGGRDGVEVGYFTFSWTPLHDEAGAIRGFVCNGLETTERVEAGRAFRRMFEASPTPFLVLSPDAPRFTIAEVNDAYLAAVMRTREELLGHGLFEVMPDNPADPGATGVANLRASLERAIATRRPDTMPRQRYDIPHPNGGFEERWWDPVNSPLLGAGGEVEAIIHHVVDVTDRKRAEEALRATAERNIEILESISGAFYAVDAGWRFTYVNRRAEAWWGRAREDLVGRVYWDEFPQAVGSEPYKAHLRAAETREVVRLEAVSPILGHWVDISIYPTADGGLSVYFRDTTEKKQAEAALRELNETLEQRVAERTAERDRVWANSRDLLLVVGTDGVFRAVNPAWTSLLGWRADELVGHSYLDFILPEDRPSSLDAFAVASREGLPVFENRYRHKDGSYRWISWLAVPEGDRIYAYGRDVTAEKERLAELAAAQEALRQSQKLESMGQLTGGVAHDFNNLLTPIVGSLDMLQRRGLGSEREQQLIGGAMQSAERAKTLVQRLLAFARRQPLQPVPIDLGGLIEGMADLVASTSGPRVRVEVDVAPELPPVTADPNQLEMAILNLAVNARDAMPDGGALTIAARPEAVATRHRSQLAPGRYVRLSVSDTGVGMDEATLARAIEPFFSTKGVGKGTGLGLSMVHGLAAQLGGATTIQSRPGFGTTVELWLPVASAKAPEAGKTERAVEVSAVGTALLVDDEELVRASTADMLADLGYAVVEAASGEEALRLVDGGLAPDLVVTDHLMPGMTGTDLARALKDRLLAPNLLVISGYAEDDGVAPDLPRLTKPFRQAELAAKLAGLDGTG